MLDDGLTADDPLYDALYDVRREAQSVGNFIDRDVMPEIHALRARAPVHKGKLRELLGLPGHDRHVFAKGRQHWTALTWDACEDAFRDPQVFSNRVQHHPNPANELQMGILEMDPPMHRAYRRTIQPKFLMPEAIGWWRARTIDSIVERLIERLAKRDRAELNIDFCARLPVHAITTAIGLGGEEALRFRHAYLHSTSASRDIPMEERVRNGQLVETLLLDLIADRRRAARDDLVSYLAQSTLRLPGEAPRPLTDREILTHAKLVMVAGGGTSWRQMGIALFALLTHEDQFAAVKQERSLLEAAIEESLRWLPTAPFFYRLVTQDIAFHGCDLKAGDVIELGLGPANRDPARWSTPDSFDLFRPRLTNMAFGLGTHRCLGMNVAQVEIARGIGALLDTFEGLRLDPQAPAPFITGGLEQQGVSGLPVLLR